jgi:hypothetical protein
MATTLFSPHAEQPVDEALVESVWKKARTMTGRDPAEWRQDQCGAWLHRQQLDNDGSEFGWRIIKVVAEPGASVAGLQPFHCDNSFDIENHRPRCRTMADRGGLAAGQHVDRPRNARG